MMKLLSHPEGTWLLNRELCSKLSALYCLFLLTSLRTDAFEISRHPVENIDFSRIIGPKKPTEEVPAKVGEAHLSAKSEFRLTDDVFPKKSKEQATEESEARSDDETVFLPKGKVVIADIVAKQDAERLKEDDGMSVEDTIMSMESFEEQEMPEAGMSSEMPEAGMSSEMPEPFKKDVPLKSSTMGDEMPVVQGSDTDSVMPQLYIQEGTLIPMAQTEEQSSDGKPSSQMKKGDGMSSTEPSWSSSGLLDKEVSTQKETEQVTEAEVQTGERPQTGRDFLRGVSLGSIRDEDKDQIEAEKPKAKEHIFSRDTVGDLQQEIEPQQKVVEPVSEEGSFLSGMAMEGPSQKIQEQKKAAEPVPKKGAPLQDMTLGSLLREPEEQTEAKELETKESTLPQSVTGSLIYKAELQRKPVESTVEEVRETKQPKIGEKEAEETDPLSTAVIDVSQVLGGKSEDIKATSQEESGSGEYETKQITEESKEKKIAQSQGGDTSFPEETIDSPESETSPTIEESATDVLPGLSAMDEDREHVVLATTSSIGDKDEETSAADHPTVSTETPSTRGKETDVGVDTHSTLSGAISGTGIKKDVHEDEQATVTSAASIVSKTEGDGHKDEQPAKLTEISSISGKDGEGDAVVEESAAPTATSSISGKDKGISTEADKHSDQSATMSDTSSEEDVRVSKEPAELTTISSVSEKGKERDTVAKEPADLTAISDVRQEEDVHLVKEPAESTEVSITDEGEEEISSDKHPIASEAVPSVDVKTEHAGKMPSASEDPIRSASPTETPQPESTPELSLPQESATPQPETTPDLSLPQESATPQPESTPDLSLPQESATPSKQEPITDPGDTEHVEAVERHPPKHSPLHQVEEEQVQVEDQASGSSATGDESVESPSGEKEKASVAAKAADPSTPTTIDPSTTSSPKQVSTMASLMEFVDSVVGNSTNVKTDVDTPDGRVAILVEEGGELKLEHLEIEPMEGVDVLVKMTGGELKLDDVSIRQRPQPRTLRRALNSEASIKTGLIVDGGAVVSIRNSTFESATDTMVKVTGGSHFSCSDCDFKNNAGDRGGALLVQNSTLHLQECRMTENVANSGGAIHFDGSGSIVDVGASMQIENTLFSQNEARGSGASVYMNSAREIRIADTEFRHGSASNGGAIYVQDVHTVRIEQSHFVDNKADESGGGLVAKSIQMLSVLKSTFENNAALSSFAGAGLLSDCDDAIFRQTDFIGNRAVEGGALANFAHSLFLNRFYLQKTQFINNKADNLGGALLMRGDKFEESIHDKQSRSEPFLASINSTSFLGNSARMGAGVFISSDVLMDYDVKIVMLRTNFTRNKAYETGGGVHCGHHSKVVLSHSSFEHNEAHKGMNCAQHCGCQVTVMNPRSHLSDNEARRRWVQDTCTSDRAETPYSGKESSNLMVYVCVSLGAVLVFSVVAALIVVRKQRVTTRENSVSRDDEEQGLLPTGNLVDETDYFAIHASDEESTSSL